MEAFLKKTIIEAGKIIEKKFGKVGVKYTKHDATDVVTEADLASNAYIVKAIKKKFSAHGIISEETGKENVAAENVWIIDPLDGTRNFATHVPLFAVSIAFAIKGEVQLAGAYDPIHKEFFIAKKDQGASCNGIAIHCSKATELNDTWGCGTAILRPEENSALESMLRAADTTSFWLSNLGSLVLNGALVASGRRDWMVSRGAFVWDYAAVSLILKEAGCTVTNLSGRPWQLSDREMIAANPWLHPVIVKMIQHKK